MDEELLALVPTLPLENDVNQGGFGFHQWFYDRFCGFFNWMKNISIPFEEHSCNCLALIFILWCIASMVLIGGVYGPHNTWIGPSSSILVKPNPFWVQSIKVKELDDSRSGLELFGFYKSPPLDVIVNWSESRLLSISPRSFKGWPYYLNNGATLNISYSIKSEGSSALLIVDQVLRHFSDSLFEEPLYQKNALSWNLLRGTGVIELKISEASTYFVSLYNFNIRDVKVELDIDVRAVLYDTKQSFYKCNFSNGNCTYNTMSLLGNSFVLTSPALEHGAPVEGWYIRFSYQPRWIGYVIGTGLVICFTLVAIKLWKMLFTCLTVDDSTSSQRRRLLANKDDDGSSMGSSLAGDDADLEDFMGNEGDSTTCRCAICFDAPRDCFFLPCGHCVSCYQCGKKIAEASGSCPICRRKLKKVKRIFRV